MFQRQKMAKLFKVTKMFKRAKLAKMFKRAKKKVSHFSKAQLL